MCISIRVCIFLRSIYLNLYFCRICSIVINYIILVSFSGLICGTSTCHMVVSEKPIFVPGVWGPYKNAMVPNMWLNEGGQSATGKLIDHIIDSHPAAENLKKTLVDK